MASLLEAFPGARRVIVTVPAGPELCSNYDTFYRHYRRYTLATLAATVGSMPGRIRDLRYFCRLLYTFPRGRSPCRPESAVRFSALPPRRLTYFIDCSGGFFFRIIFSYPGGFPEPRRSAPSSLTSRYASVSPAKSTCPGPRATACLTTDAALWLTLSPDESPIRRCQRPALQQDQGATEREPLVRERQQSAGSINCPAPDQSGDNCFSSKRFSSTNVN